MTKKPKRISTGELSTLAAQSVERALQVRSAADVELSQAELEQVSGGLAISIPNSPKPILIKPPIISGAVPPIRILF
jgi:hypothetical protein